MRVLLFTRNLLYYTCELANGLTQAEADVLLLYPQDGGDAVVDPDKTAGDLVDEISEEGVGRKAIDLPQGTRLRDLPRTVMSILHAVRLAKRFRPDVIHVQQNRDWRLYLTLRLLQRTAPIVLTLHDASAHPGEEWDKKSLFVRDYLRRTARRIIVHGQSIRNQLAGSGIDEAKIRIIPHGAYGLYRRWMNPVVKMDEQTVLFYGRMHKYKGLEILIDAIPLVQEQLPEAKFVIAGSGPALDEMRPQLERFQNVQVMSRRILNDETARLFQEAAVIVLPYIEASQSGVINIAYAFGKPVVASDVGALPEVVDHGATGLLVPPSDPQTLADALVSLLSDRALWNKCSEGAAKMADGPLSWRQIARQTVEVYEEALAEFGKP